MEWHNLQEYDWSKEVSSYEKISSEHTRPLWRLYIKGPAGNIYADDIVSIYDRYDYIDLLYWEMIAVRDGHYHCCLSGKTFIF